MKIFTLLGLTVVYLFAPAYAMAQARGKPTGLPAHDKHYVVVAPGTHPALLFSKQEVGQLRRKAHAKGLPGQMWKKIKRLAHNQPIGAGWGIESGNWNKRGMRLDAKALIYAVEGDKQVGRQALQQMKNVLAEIDPHQYYFGGGKSNMFWVDDWPKAFAYAYDWLYPLMSETERARIADQLKQWCKALYEHTESHWWRDASYNVGAIPVGALGLLCVAIQGQEGGQAEFDKWLTSALTRIRDNYFPTVWRQNGISYEGPDYAQYARNPLLFGEALRRTGGPDIVSGSGAINAMHYQRFQWKPAGGEGPIGDNTHYGRRVFQGIYLLGIGLRHDRAGLHTFLKWAKRGRVNPILTFLLYPAKLRPKSAGKQGLPTSYYFEITPRRAGYFYGRSAWDDRDAAYFAFVTRDEVANHQHYDMDTFLFSAFGEDFATHANLYPYKDRLHGLDKEHNIVIVDGGGMPGHDAIDGAIDDNSLNGYMAGEGTGHFADYVRGDAARSYQDRSVSGSTPAVRADRYGAFVKQGPNPYVIMIDDIRKSRQGDHSYDWLWHSKALKLGGGDGTLKNPLIIPGEKANCEVGFVTPRRPRANFKVVSGRGSDKQNKLGLIDVHQHGKRVQYFAIGAAWKKGQTKPTFKPGPKPTGNHDAYTLDVKGDGFTDHILWQPREFENEPARRISVDRIVTDAFLSVVRTDPAGKITGYLMGGGTMLMYGDRVLARSRDHHLWTVSADAARLVATGKRRARANLPPLPAKGRVWLPGIHTAVRVDGKVIEPKVIAGRMAMIR